MQGLKHGVDPLSRIDGRVSARILFGPFDGGAHEAEFVTADGMIGAAKPHLFGITFLAIHAAFGALVRGEVAIVIQFLDQENPNRHPWAAMHKLGFEIAALWFGCDLAGIAVDCPKPPRVGVGSTGWCAHRPISGTAAHPAASWRALVDL